MRVLTVTKDNQFVISTRRSGNLYILQGSTVTGAKAVTTILLSETNHTKLWHLRMRYMSEKGMTILGRRRLNVIQNAGKLDFYKHCIFSKQKRINFGVAEYRTNNMLDYIYSNL